MTPPDILRAKLSQTITPYVPANAVEQVVAWIIEYKIKLTVTDRRQSVYGDYRNPDHRVGHRISVNGDLNKYAFLITFVHEVAHLVVWEKHLNKVSAHGAEWKNMFKRLMSKFFEAQIFPDDINTALKQYMQDPAATNCNDIHLTKALARYDAKPVLHLADIADGELFGYEAKVFRRVSKVRTRIKCIEIKTNTLYLFNAVAEVKRVVNPS